MKVQAQICMVINLDKCIGSPHLLGHLQERLDQPQGYGIRLVQ